MRFLLIAAVLCAGVAFAAPLTLEESQYMFTGWALQHQKQYTTDEFFHRFNVFRQNAEFIRQENAKGHSYKLGFTVFADMSNEEYNAKVVGMCFQAPPARKAEAVPAVGQPTVIDWNEKGVLYKVKDQGSCGSCWAFSALGALESHWAIKHGELHDLSEQQLVDCSGSAGNHGCNGGLMTNSYAWLARNGGSCLTKDYPYRARDLTCQTSCKPVAFVTGYKNVPAYDEVALGEALELGPVAVAVAASSSAWQLYKEGVVDTAACGTGLNHGVVLYGYADDNQGGYWKIKNSWGVGWGNQGHIYLRYGKNICGVSQMNTYPLL